MFNWFMLTSQWRITVDLIFVFMCITFHYARYCQQDSCFLLEKMAFQAMWRKPSPARHGFAAPVRLTARCVPRSVMHLGRLVRWMGGKGSEHKLQYIYILSIPSDCILTKFYQNFWTSMLEVLQLLACHVLVAASRCFWVVVCGTMSRRHTDQQEGHKNQNKSDRSCNLLLLEAQSWRLPKAM